MIRRVRTRLRRRLTASVAEVLESRQLLAGDTVTLVADQAVVHQNSAPASLDVLSNDLFGDQYSGAREVTAVSYGTEGGRIEIAADRKSIVYAPAADFQGSEQFSYFVDGSFLTTVDVTVRSPLASDRYQLPPDGQLHRLDVLANDPFWAGYTGAKRITLVSVTSGESEVQVAPDGRAVLYWPSESAAGAESFTYIVDEIYSTTVVVESPAVLAADQFEILQNSPARTLNVLANDPFWTGYSGPRQITHIASDQNAFGGTIEIGPNGASVVYTPAEDHQGYDQFTYVVDGRFEAGVTLYIQRPVQDDSFEVDHNSLDHPLDVLANDHYWSYLQQRTIDAVNRVTSVGPSEQGGTVAVRSDGSGVIYSAPAGFSGTDTFTYVADGLYTASVMVQVTRPVRDDYLTAFQDTPNQLLAVLQNDFFGNGYVGPRQLTAVSASQQQATLAIAGASIRYTPPAGYTGGDSFTYTVDGQLEALVNVSVVPLAQYDSYHFCPQPNQTHALRVLDNDYFNRGYLGPGRITAADLASGGGQISVSADGRSLQFQPNSQSWAQINYTVDDQYSSQAVVWRDNHLVGDQKVVDQNSASVRLDVLANDFRDNDWNCSPGAYTGARRITAVGTSEQGGALQVSSDGRGVEYQPPADFFGEDRFTYVVDGTMEATVQVQVVRRVRDDQVRVIPGQLDRLSVLANDLFGADYQGAQRITHVTPSAVGATVSISSDGRQLLYTAPVGFVGSDTLTYTVDGRLKASVALEVRSDDESRFPQFGSLGEFEQFLIDDALVRYSNQFGQPAYRGWPWIEDGDTSAGPPDAPGRDHSETNVQVAGIDEGDIVEFDEDYVYFLTGNDVVILDAWPAEELHEISRTPIVGQPIGQYLHGDRLTVVSQTVTWPEWPAWPGPVDGGPLVDVGRPFDFYYFEPPSYQTIVTVLDVSDRAEPGIVQQTTFEGQYIQSRAIGDFVYLTLSNLAVPAGPRIVPDPDVDPNNPTWGQIGTYETAEQYLARVQADLGEYVDETLPNYVSVGADGQVARSGLVHEPEEIFRPLTEGATSLVSLVSINIANSEPGLASSSGVYTNGATQIYASLEHFYVFENGYQPQDGNVTRILQFDWNSLDGSARFSAAGLVPGYMLNQFSADEYQGHLRIATTVTHAASGNWTNRSENDLFVLRDDGGVLEFVGSLQNLGLGETARSVRYMGPRAFLVTFRNVDPLFGLDLSDPASPQSVGHLTLPGFSSYMQFVADDRLLTVGTNTPNGVAGPAQVTLFDVSDLTQPRMIDEYTLDRYSYTEAAVDHHAFGYFARHGLLAVPSARSYIVRTDEDQDGYAETRSWVTQHELMVFRIDTLAAPGTNQGVQLVAEIEHDSPVRRSGYIDDKLFSIADDSIHVVDVTAPQSIVATASDLRDDEPVPPLPIEFDPHVDLVFAQVQADLAARLSVTQGAVMPVVVEQSGGDWQTVVRVNDNYYRYQGDGASLTLTGVNFEFGAAGELVSWQNPVDPADVNGDGQVTPSDAILIVNRLGDAIQETLPDRRVLRQIQDAQQIGGPYWDASGDGVVSVADVLTVVARINSLVPGYLDTGSLDIHQPQTLDDQAAVAAFYDRVLETVGDANLDGRFDSGDLVLIFQRGQYENGIDRSAGWSDGDWDGDGMFTTSDLVLAFTHGRYAVESRAVDRVFAV